MVIIGSLQGSLQSLGLSTVISEIQLPPLLAFIITSVPIVPLTVPSPLFVPFVTLISAPEVSVYLKVKVFASVPSQIA